MQILCKLGQSGASDLIFKCTIVIGMIFYIKVHHIYYYNKICINFMLKSKDFFSLNGAIAWEHNSYDSDVLKIPQKGLIFRTSKAHNFFVFWPIFKIQTVL